MRRTVAICCAGILLLGGIWLYTWWHSPAETKKFTAGNQTQDILGSETTLTSWSTASFATRYPANLRLITSNEVAHGNTSGQYVLGSVSLRQTDQLAITVGPLQYMALSDLPAVKLRQQRVGAYQPTERSFVPEGGLVFSGTGEYETAVFWRQNDRYAAVVVSGSSVRKAELEQALQTVVTNWQWR